VVEHIPAATDAYDARQECPGDAQRQVGIDHVPVVAVVPDDVVQPLATEDVDRCDGQRLSEESLPAVS
jgi:hypothetical protein